MVSSLKGWRIKNYWDKTSGSGQSRTFLKTTYFQHVVVERRRKHGSGASTLRLPFLSVSLGLMARPADNIQLHKVKLNLRKVHTIFFMCAARGFT